MINAIQHSIICETLTIWAAEYAAGFPSVHEVIYDLLTVMAMEFEACASAVESVVSFVEGGVETCEEIYAELVAVEPAIGLNGVIVPVATIRNSEMGQSDLFRHRMPHWGMSDYLGLHDGCRVTLKKRIGCAPELYGCVDTGRNSDSYTGGARWVPPEGHGRTMFTTPALCPFCGDRVVSDREDIVCVNPDCRSKVGSRVARFVSVGGMAIPGMTERVVDQLLVAGKLERVEDLYSLKVADFIDACHVTHTDAYVLFKSVERSKLKPLHMLLDGMGIPGIGREETPVLAECISAAGGLSKLVSDMDGFYAGFIREAESRSVSGNAVASFVKFSRNNIESIGRFVELGVAQVAIPVGGDRPVESKKMPVNKKRFNYGSMQFPTETPKRRKMRRRKRKGDGSSNNIG